MKIEHLTGTPFYMANYKGIVALGYSSYEAILRALSKFYEVPN
jgi:hypothetical protein